MAPNPADYLKIKLNQNLWGLIVSFIALGAAEYLMVLWELP
jgi:hypothetical protein